MSRIRPSNYYFDLRSDNYFKGLSFEVSMRRNVLNFTCETIRDSRSRIKSHEVPEFGYFKIHMLGIGLEAIHSGTNGTKRHA
jgi:hypothetical protein